MHRSAWVQRSEDEQWLSLAKLWKGYAVAQYSVEKRRGGEAMNSDAGRGEGMAMQRAALAWQGDAMALK